MQDLVLHHFACDTDAENQAIWRGMMQAKALGSAETALMTRFLYCFPLFEALFRILGKLTLL